jgi:hypothetical protein
MIFWSATACHERLQLLAQNRFKLIDYAAVTGRHQPALLVRALTPDLPVSKWLFGGLKLVEMADWDLRMLYSMRG